MGPVGLSPPGAPEVFDMERTDTDLLEVLFARDPELGSPVAESLATLDQPEYTPRVVEVLASWLERFPGDTNRTEADSVTDSRGESSAPEIEPPQRSVFDAVARCSVSAPDESQVFWEPLSRLTAHEESRFRCGAYRCLGCLGAAGGMESSFVAETVADGLADESPAVRRVALWSLTRLALTAPDAVAPFRGDVLTQLEATSSKGRETTDALTRRHAAEALVASATGGYAPERDRPERGFELSPERSRNAAAWAIQTQDGDHGPPVPDRDGLPQNTDPTDGHSIARRLYHRLDQELGDAAGVRRDSLLLALGYLGPAQPDMTPFLKPLNAAIDAGGRAEAVARWVLEHGPFAPAPDPDETRPPVDLPVTDRSDWLEVAPPQHPVFPVRAKSDRDVLRWRRIRLVCSRLSGGGHTVCTPRWRMEEPRTGIGLQAFWQRVLGVETGDQVTDEVVAARPARRLVVGLAPGSPLAAEDITAPNGTASRPLQQALAGRYAIEDGVVHAAVTLEPERVGEGESAESLLGRQQQGESGQMEGRLLKALPLRVRSVEPARPSIIVPATEVRVAADADLWFDGWWDETAPGSATLVEAL